MNKKGLFGSLCVAVAGVGVSALVIKRKSIKNTYMRSIESFYGGGTDGVKDLSMEKLKALYEAITKLKESIGITDYYEFSGLDLVNLSDEEVDVYMDVCEIISEYNFLLFDSDEDLGGVINYLEGIFSPKTSSESEIKDSLKDDCNVEKKEDESSKVVDIDHIFGDVFMSSNEEPEEREFYGADLDFDANLVLTDEELDSLYVGEDKKVSDSNSTLMTEEEEVVTIEVDEPREETESEVSEVTETDSEVSDVAETESEVSEVTETDSEVSEEEIVKTDECTSSGSNEKEKPVVNNNYKGSRKPRHRKKRR